MKSIQVFISRSLRDFRCWIFFFVACSLTFLVRFTLAYPVITPDSKLYIRLAGNIFTNLCYSTSAIESADCKPSWGSQPPGYPIFVGIITKFFGGEAQHIVLAQTALFALAAAIALWTFYRWQGRRIGLLISFLLLTFSPLSVAWSRWVLTETLAAAAALLTFAILFRSLKARKLNTISVGCCIAVATFIRWDQIWLLVPATVCAFYFDGILKGVRHTVLMGSLVGFLPVLMIARAAVVGLPLLPNSVSEPGPPKGAVLFWQNAAKSQEATRGFLWRLWGREYEGLAKHFDYDSISSSFNTTRFRIVMDRIGALPNGASLPKEIDAELTEIAVAKRGIGSWVSLYWQRALNIWTGEDRIFWSGWETFTPAQTIERVCQIYRIILLSTCFILLCFVRGLNLVLLIGLLFYIIIRSLFLVSLTMLETRYLMPVFPVIELVVPSLVFGIGVHKETQVV